MAHTGSIAGNHDDGFEAAQIKDETGTYVGRVFDVLPAVCDPTAYGLPAGDLDG